MSALLITQFLLTGDLVGATVSFREFNFHKGVMEYHGTAEDTALVTRSLERNWQAYPKGHPALNPAKENNDGKRNLSDPNANTNGSAKVSGGEQSAGTGSEASGGAGDGGGDADPNAGAETELANGDGQPAVVNAEPKAEPNSKLMRAIHKLDAADDTHWTSAGLPAMHAVEGFYGATDITRADVEAAAPGLTRASLRAATK